MRSLLNPIGLLDSCLMRQLGCFTHGYVKALTELESLLGMQSHVHGDERSSEDQQQDCDECHAGHVP